MERLNCKYVTTDYLECFRNKEGDAGFDLFVEEDTWIMPFRIKKVPLNIRLEIPEGYYGFVTSRSGESLKGVVVVPGIIDRTYRGKVNAITMNFSFLPKRIKRGTRVCQIIFHSYLEPIFQKEFKLSDSDRGYNGFGSSGV